MAKSSTPTPTTVIYRFAGFEVHEFSLELRDSTGARVEITPLAFDLLVYLIRHRDRVVPNDELFERMWGDVAVTASSLSQGIWAVRNAVGDTGATKRVIQNVRSRGYRMIADVEVIEPAPLGPAPPAAQSARHAPPARSSLIGREPELSRLRAALSDALGGRGRISLLTGWPGMGKTCLAQELCGIARAEGARVLEARCFEDDAMPPFWPWQQIARALLRQHSQGELSAWAGDGAADLIKIVPELGERIPRPPHAPQREPGHHRFQLFEALAGLLQKSAEQSPLVLVLEDLHWADESTLRFLEFLAPSIERMSILLVATLRAHAGDGALETTAGSVLRQPGSSLLELSGLDAAQVEALLRVHDVAPLSPALVQRVTELTFGNPFFVTRLAQWLAVQPGRALDGPIALPREARAIVRELIAALPSACRELLEVASVLGQSFHVSDLRRVRGGSAQEVLESLEPALAARILHADTEEVGVYSFAHSTMRETLYADLPRARRARLHGLAAAGIAQAHPDPTPRLSEIARHYYEAAAAGAASEAVRYCRLAAERAYDATAFEESVAYYKRALAALECIEPPDERERCELLLGLGRALRGTRVALDEVQAVFASAAEIAQRIGDVRLLCEAAMRHAGRSAMRMEVMREHGTVNPAEIELLERALERIQAEESSDRALVEAWLAHSLYHSERGEERKRRAEHAVHVARRVGDPLVLAECSMLLQASVCGPDELDARIETLSEIIELTRRHNAPGLQLDAHVERAFSYWERADRARAEADIQSVERLAEELRQPREKRKAAVWRAMLLDAEGRFDDGDRAFRDIELAYPLPAGRVAQGRAIRDLYLLWLRGRVHEAVPALEAYAAKYPLPVAWHSGLPSVYASAGRTDAAQRELDRLAIDDFAAIPDDHNFIGSLGQLAWAAFLLRDVERCGALYRKLAPYADRVYSIGLHGFCSGVVHRSLGELSIVLGELRRAEMHLTEAIEANTRVGAALWAAQARLSYAELLVQRNARTDRAGAFEQLAAAGLFARSRGIQLLVDRAERLRELAAGSAASGRRA